MSAAVPLAPHACPEQPACAGHRLGPVARGARRGSFAFKAQSPLGIQRPGRRRPPVGHVQETREGLGDGIRSRTHTSFLAFRQEGGPVAAHRRRLRGQRLHLPRVPAPSERSGGGCPVRRSSLKRAKRSATSPRQDVAFEVSASPGDAGGSASLRQGRGPGPAACPPAACRRPRLRMSRAEPSRKERQSQEQDEVFVPGTLHLWGSGFALGLAASPRVCWGPSGHLTRPV